MKKRSTPKELTLGMIFAFIEIAIRLINNNNIFGEPKMYGYHSSFHSYNWHHTYCHWNKKLVKKQKEEINHV